MGIFLAGLPDEFSVISILLERSSEELGGADVVSKLQNQDEIILDNSWLSQTWSRADPTATGPRWDYQVGYQTQKG